MQSNFKWWYAIIGYVAYILSFLVNTWLSTMAQGWFEGTAFNSGALFNITMFIVGGIICLVLFRIISKNKISRLEFGLHLNNLSKVILIGAGLGLLFFGFTELVEANSKSLKEASEQVSSTFNIGKNFTNDIFLLLNIGLFAPVVEEILFRGAIFNPIYQSLKKKTSFPHWVALGIGLLVSALLFAFSHGGGGQEAQLGLLGVLGILAALAMYFTKNLFGAIMVHAVNNNLVFIFMVHKTLGLGSAYGIQLAVASIVCLILCFPLGLLLGKILPRVKK